MVVAGKILPRPKNVAAARIETGRAVHAVVHPNAPLFDDGSGRGVAVERMAELRPIRAGFRSSGASEQGKNENEKSHRGWSYFCGLFCQGFPERYGLPTA